MDVETGRLLSAGVKFTRFIEYVSKMKTTTKQMKINMLFYSNL